VPVLGLDDREVRRRLLEPLPHRYQGCRRRRVRPRVRRHPVVRYRRHRRQGRVPRSPSPEGSRGQARRHGQGRHGDDANRRRGLGAGRWQHRLSAPGDRRDVLGSGLRVLGPSRLQRQVRGFAREGRPRSARRHGNRHHPQPREGGRAFQLHGRDEHHLERDRRTHGSQAADDRGGGASAQESGDLPVLRQATSQGHSALRPSGVRQDHARQGDDDCSRTHLQRRRGICGVHLHQGPRDSRPLRGCRRGDCPADLCSGAQAQGDARLPGGGVHRRGRRHLGETRFGHQLGHGTHHRSHVPHGDGRTRGLGRSGNLGHEPLGHPRSGSRSRRSHRSQDQDRPSDGGECDRDFPAQPQAGASQQRVLARGAGEARQR